MFEICPCCGKLKRQDLGNMPEGEFDGVVASPPWQQSIPNGAPQRGYPDLTTGAKGDNYGATEGQLANMPAGELDACVASPPYAGSIQVGKDGIDWSKVKGEEEKPNRSTGRGAIADGYGLSEGQLAALPEGEFDAIVSSPPYAQALSGKTNQTERDRQHRESIGRDPDSPGSGYPRHYGQSDGQLASLPEGELDQVVASDELDGVVSSPPHGDSMGGGVEDVEAREQRVPGFKQGMTAFQYGQNPNTFLSKDPSGLNNEQRHELAAQNPQVGVLHGDTFWSAAKAIVQQVYQVLAPGAPAVWVVKSFVRKGKRVDFPNQWRKLCESVGFETVHLHRAWLVEDRGSQFDLFGKLHENQVARKSFFRRLHEFHASAKMYWNEHITDRDTKVRYIRNAHRELWESYHIELTEDKKQHQLPPSLPTRSRIVADARVSAYKDAGEPWMDIDTRIDFEIVLCMRKPA